MTAHCGLHNLAKALNHILVEHIRALLPSLKTSIEDMLDKRFHELKLYGDPLSGQSAGTRYALLLMCHNTRYAMQPCSTRSLVVVLWVLLLCLVRCAAGIPPLLMCDMAWMSM